MAIVNGRFLVAENPQLSIIRETDHRRVGKATSVVSKNATNETITVTFDSIRNPCITSYEYRDVGEGFFSLYNRQYKLSMDNCVFSHTIVQDDARGFVSHVEVETLGGLQISER